MNQAPSDQKADKQIDQQIPRPIKDFLIGRDLFEPSALFDFLNPKLSLLKDPMTMNGMDRAIARLVLARQRQEKIALYGDYDLDGTGAVAMLESAFKQLGFEDLVLMQPKRLTDGYGLHAHLIDELANKQVQLILTADVGITAVEAAAHAKHRNLDLIITDHHLPGPVLPEALAIVNPNQPGCPSGLGYLCGTGVAFYLTRALKGALVRSKIIPDTACDLRGLLDFFVIATVTDMVPLREDNRVLVKHGLRVLENTSRPGFKVLLRELDLGGRSLSAADVAIKFAPKLNALSRMEKDLLPLDVYRAVSDAEAEALVSQVLDNNSDRREQQQIGDQEAARLMKEWDDRNFIFLYSEQFHRGIVGLVATKLSQSYRCPTFVGSLQREDGTIVGSCRIPDNCEVSLVSALESASEHLVKHGGHAAAAGFEVHVGNVPNLILSLKGYFSKIPNLPNSEVELIGEGIEQTSLVYDSVIASHEINQVTMQWLDQIGPFGVGFPAPIFYMPKLQVLSVQVLRGGHLKIQFLETENTEPGKVTALWFSPGTEVQLNPGQIVDLTCELQWNYFAGKKSVQILIKKVILL